jgi:hypothetical protein
MTNLEEHIAYGVAHKMIAMLASDDEYTFDKFKDENDGGWRVEVGNVWYERVYLSDEQLHRVFDRARAITSEM